MSLLLAVLAAPALAQPAATPTPEFGPAPPPPPVAEDGLLHRLFEGVTVTPGLYVPLDRGPSPDRAGVARDAGSPMATLNIRYTPRAGWFAQATGYAYLEADRRQFWQGDFSYSFGYDDWRPNTFSLVYANYGDNRLSRGVQSDFLQGVVSAAYKFNLPQPLADPLLIDRTQAIGCRVAYNFAVEYEREDGTVAHDKHSASLGCRYPVWRRAYLEWTAYRYLRGEQRAWDPDYTYGFGWYDWRPHRFSLQYSNYSGNRFPGRRRAPGAGRFRDGQISLTWNHAF